MSNFATCRQQKRSAALRLKRSGSCGACRPHRLGTTSCIAFTCVRRLKLALQISDRAACILTPPSEESLGYREHCLVLGSAEGSAVDSEVHRAGFRGLCGANGGAHCRARGARRDIAVTGTSCSRVSRRAVEGSSRITLSHHLRFSEEEFRVVTIVHFKQRLQKKRLTRR